MTDGTRREATAASGVKRARLEGGKRSGSGCSAAEESRNTRSRRQPERSRTIAEANALARVEQSVTCFPILGPVRGLAC